jgi:hypothetical protein
MAVNTTQRYQSRKIQNIELPPASTSLPQPQTTLSMYHSNLQNLSHAATMDFGGSADVIIEIEMGMVCRVKTATRRDYVESAKLYT